MTPTSPASAPLETRVDIARALRFLQQIGQLGASLTMSMRASAPDPELVANLPIVVVSQLYLHGPLRPVELQRVTGLTSGGMTKLLDRMEAAGLVGRTHGGVPGDRRAIEISLSAHGYEMASAISDVIISHADELAASFAALAEEARRLASKQP